MEFLSIFNSFAYQYKYNNQIVENKTHIELNRLIFLELWSLISSQLLALCMLETELRICGSSSEMKASKQSAVKLTEAFYILVRAKITYQESISDEEKAHSTFMKAVDAFNIEALKSLEEMQEEISTTMDESETKQHFSTLKQQLETSERRLSWAVKAFTIFSIVTSLTAVGLFVGVWLALHFSLKRDQVIDKIGDISLLEGPEKNIGKFKDLSKKLRGSDATILMQRSPERRGCLTKSNTAPGLFRLHTAAYKPYTPSMG